MINISSIYIYHIRPGVDPFKKETVVLEYISSTLSDLIREYVVQISASKKYHDAEIKSTKITTGIIFGCLLHLHMLSFFGPYQKMYPSKCLFF